MKGSNKIILNDETMAEMVEKYMNAHVVKDELTVVRVSFDYETGTNNRYWVAYIEPKKLTAERTAE